MTNPRAESGSLPASYGTVCWRMLHQANAPANVPASPLRNYVLRHTRLADAILASHQMLYSHHPAGDQKRVDRTPLATQLRVRAHMARLCLTALPELQNWRRH